MKRVGALFMLLSALALAACGNEPAAGSGDLPGGSLDGDWTLVEGTVSGEPIHALRERGVTLTVDGDEVSGSSACNSYFGTVEIDGSSVRFEGLGGTEMACEPDVMALEQTYLAALADVHSAAIEDDQLVLTGDQVELRFDPVEPAEPAALVGTAWVLEATIGSGGPGGSASSPVGEPATLELTADGKVAGSTGCNAFGGTYELVDDTLTLGRLIQTQVACPDDVAAQEETLMALFVQPLTVSIDGGFLTLTAADESGLVYRLQDPSTDPVPPEDPGTAAGWWLLREGVVDGEPLDLEGQRVTLGIDGESVQASVGCNEYGASMRVDGSAVTIMIEGGTDMGCGELAALETAYVDALQSVQTIERSADQLVLAGPDITLTFEPLPALGAEGLVGRTWTLDAVVDEKGAATSAVGAGEIIFAEDGTFQGIAGGCAYGGTYVIEGDHVRMPDYGIEDPACEMTSPGYEVFAAQGDGFVPLVDGDTMTVTFPDDTAAIYVAERPAG